MYDGPEETIAHAELRYGDGLVMLGSERAGYEHRRAGHGWAYVVVEDLGAHYERAKSAGAEITDEPSVQDYGSF